MDISYIVSEPLNVIGFQMILMRASLAYCLKSGGFGNTRTLKPGLKK